MSENLPHLTYSVAKDGKRIVLVEDVMELFPDIGALLTAVPALAIPEGLAVYCDAINYLARGYIYRVIHDPAAFAERYKARLQAEDPSAPFVEGAPRLSDFGEVDLTGIEPPKVVDETVVFFAEEVYLGIPYRAVAPGPRHPAAAVTYEPLPT